MAKILQLLRSNTVYGSKALAVAALGDETFLAARKDGEIVLARYYYGEGASKVAKSIMGVYHVEVPLGGETGTTKTGVTILEDNSAIDDVLAGLDYNLEANDNKVVTDVNQENGLVSAASKNLTAIKLDGYAVGADDSGKVAATDTLGEALGKLQGQINGMDKAASAADGQVVTTIAEADGKVSETKANVKDLQLGGYSKDANASGAIGSTDTINVALSKLENAATANKVANADGSITVTDGNSSTATDVKVHIKSGERVIKLDNNGDGIYTNLNLTKVTTGLSANVREKYQLLDSDGNQIGADIEIYKDSSLNNIFVGHIDDALTNADAQGESVDTAVTSGTGDAALVYIMHLENDKYKLAAVNVESFLEENEFSDGLQVINHVVSVKIDSTSEKDGQATPVDFLTVGASGIKISGIKDEIARQINLLDTPDTAVAGQYISQVVEANGLLTITRANVSDAVLTGYTKGTKPAETAISAADDVKGAIAKLEHQIDDAEAAATTVVAEGTDAGDNMSIVETAGADGHKIFTINLTDVASATALSNEIARAKAAETAIDSVVGLDKNTDNETRTYTNSGVYIGQSATNTVKSDIKALDTEVANALNGVTGSNAIAVSIRSNKNQTISLTLDTTTTATTEGNQYASSNGQDGTGSNALQITSNGLYLSNNWDCGTW